MPTEGAEQSGQPEEQGKTLTLPVFEVLRVFHFGWAMQAKPDGGMILAFNTATGRRYEFTFDAEGRASLGHDILAPSVLTPGNLPPGAGRRG